MEEKNGISLEEIGKFMEGKDPQERIVNILYKYQDDYVTVLYRNENDQKCSRQYSYYPFCWATLYACTHLCEGNREELKQKMKQYGIGVKKLRNVDKNGEVRPEFDNGYLFMFYATKPMSHIRFLNFFKACKNPIYPKKDKFGNEIILHKAEKNQFLICSPQEQFMISTGKRFFKGYDDYNQLLRMTFDLETEGLDPEKHRIKMNGVSLNRSVTVNGVFYEDFEEIFKLEGITEEEKNKSELNIIENMLKCIYTFKPDVITAHNGENFDWNFLIKRCEMLGTSMEEVSKKYFTDGEFIHKEDRPSNLKLGGEIEEFYRTVVPGTTITDSLHAVRRAQATNSNFLRADLKYSTKFLNLKKPNRVYTPGDEIDNILTDKEHLYAFNNTDGDWYVYDKNSENGPDIPFKKGKDEDKPFIKYTRNYLAEGYELTTGEYIINRYLQDDLWECDKVEYTLNGTDFMLCKIIPVPFAKCCTMGTAGQWKAIMMAWSYENNLAIPKPENEKIATGGLSRLLNVGYVDNVVKLDFNSLYPSIILTWAINDKTDLMGAMLHMLEYVLTEREKYKGLKKAADKKCEHYKEKINNGETLTEEEEADYQQAITDFKNNDNRQAVVKKLGNSFFGSYGSVNGSVFPWKSSKCAEQTTCTGRQSLRLMISHFHNLGYKPIVGDTDGFNFQLPSEDKFRYTKDNPYIGLGLSRETKQGKEYVGFEADVAEFNDMYMKDFHYSDDAVNKMGLGIDEVVDATINFSRKNYSDYFPMNPFPDDVKLVGNTIKSKKMPEYISKFLETGIRQLLRKQGKEFLDEYYSYIEKIYNFQIPLKQIASKGKVKKSIDAYKKDCTTITKAGRPKSRQAWMELAIQNNLNVEMGETLYYINTGKSKSQSDVKKVTHYYVDGKESKVSLEKEWKNSTDGKLNTKEKVSFNDYVKKFHPEVKIEEEIVLNCALLPREIIESERDTFCDEDNEYNVAKYITQFNNRIKPLLVCFNPEIRDKIIITNPSDRPFFTDEECELDSGHPYKPSDQDTYEQLMTMEDKEIRFWIKYDLIPPFIKECGMGNWEDIVADYKSRNAEEIKLGIDKVREDYENIVNALTNEEITSIIEEGIIPNCLSKIVSVDNDNGNIVSKEYPEYVICTINDLLNLMEEKSYNFSESKED